MPETPPEYVAPELRVPASPTPKRRMWRTVLQTIVAVCLAVPSAVAALRDAGVDLSVKTTGIIVGGTGAFVVLVSAGQNAWDQHKGLG